MQLVVLTGPLRGAAVNLGFRVDRLSLEWTRPPNLNEPPIPEQARDGVWIPLFNRDGSVVAYTLVDDCDAALAQQRWCLHNGSYAVRSGHGRLIFMHRLIADPPAGLEVDHINRNRLDNRRANLRVATRADNARNCSRNRRSTQPYKGIRRVGKRWGAVLHFEGEWCCCSAFETPEEAAVAYDLMALALFGDFAAPNFAYREDYEQDFESLFESVGEALRVT